MKQWILFFASILMLSSAVLAPAREGPRVDVAFLLDATGSMGDEIEAVKEKIREMISEIALGEPTPDVRFGIVAYRDRGDEYVTRVYELTRDIDLIAENLDQIRANGGGDYPESFNEGLHVAVQDLNWDSEGQVSRLVFLIADAPPHMDYADDFDYKDEIVAAQERGIVVHAIGASGLDRKGEDIFKEVAAGTQGSFQWLAYETQYVDEDGEDVTVVIEGRTTTYKKGDEVWVLEEGGEIPEGLPAVGMGGRGDEVRMAEDGAEMASTAGGVGKGGGAPPVSSSTNLDDLITKAIKDAAAEGGADYKDDTGTSVESASWAQLKALHQRR